MLIFISIPTHILLPYKKLILLVTLVLPTSNGTGHRQIKFVYAPGGLTNTTLTNSDEQNGWVTDASVSETM